MIKLDDNFPIYLVKNFHIPLFSKKKIIQKLLENKNHHYDEDLGYNFPIREDYNIFFDKLYLKFYKYCQKNITFSKSSISCNTCFAYLSDKHDFKECWHDHLSTSTIVGVYYLSIPRKDNVTIDFKLHEKILTYKINMYDLIIFPNYLLHKPNRCYNNGYRISINMEICCNEPAEQIFNQIR